MKERATLISWRKSCKSVVVGGSDLNNRMKWRPQSAVRGIRKSMIS